MSDSRPIPTPELPADVRGGCPSPSNGSASVALQDYVLRATDEQKQLRLHQQWKQACESYTITCCCGQLRHISLAFRCLYCGEWYCQTCAETHFGQTVQEWVEKKRIERPSRTRGAEDAERGRSGMTPAPQMPDSGQPLTREALPASTGSVPPLDKSGASPKSKVVWVVKLDRKPGFMQRQREKRRMEAGEMHGREKVTWAGPLVEPVEASDEPAPPNVCISDGSGAQP